MQRHWSRLFEGQDWLASEGISVTSRVLAVLIYDWLAVTFIHRMTSRVKLKKGHDGHCQFFLFACMTSLIQAIQELQLADCFGYCFDVTHPGYSGDLIGSPSCLLVPRHWSKLLKDYDWLATLLRSDVTAWLRRGKKALYPHRLNG